MRAIVAHHTAAIPFESIDAFLGRGIAIDTDSLTDKLIHRRRGGYCFEQNLLLLAALRALGFDAAPRLARVLRGRTDDAMTPRTHVMLRVELADGPFPGRCRLRQPDPDRAAGVRHRGAAVHGA